MARIRSIKPELWMSPQVMDLSHSARLLFIGLITQADDEGRGTADPRRIKASIFGGDDVTSNDVAKWLAELVNRRLVVEYSTNEHGSLYELPTWRSHQKIDRPKPSTYPAPTPQSTIDLRLVDDESTNARRTLDDRSRSPRGDRTGSDGSEGSLGPDRTIEQPAAVLTLDEPRGTTGKAPFAKFWESYPKKAKRKDAQKIWRSKQLDGKVDALIADVKRRLSEDRRWVGGFVPDPTTYLRGERWNDAIEPITKNGNGQHAADAAAKEREQVLDLASMFRMEQGNDDWQTFKARVERANEKRIRNLGAKRA